MLDPLRLYEYRVALHVHSSFSDGTEPPEFIIEEAKRAGLDVLWLTDHDHRRAASEPGCGYFGHLLFLVGAEVTPRTNHYLVLGEIDPPPATLGLQAVIDMVQEKGGAGFIAHPEDRGNETARLPSYRWTDRQVQGFTGFEIWNHVSDWSRQIHNFAQGIWAALHPFSGLDEAPTDTLTLWDNWGCERAVVGVGGTDAHGIRVGRWPFRLRIFPYRKSLSAIRTHLYTQDPLSEDWRQAQSQLLSALKYGRASMVNASVGQETGFRFWAAHPDHPPVAMGGTITGFRGWVVRGLAPVPVSWRVVHDGCLRHVMEGTVLNYPLSKGGVWRVELFRGGRAWLYSNPIYVR